MARLPYPARDSMPAELTELLGSIVEVLQLVGFYWALGRICTVLDLELDHPSGLDSVLAVANLHG